MALNLNPNIFNKLKDSPQKSAVFIGLGTLVLVLALFVFAIIPATTSVIRQYDKNKRRQELVDEQDKKLNNLSRLIQLEQQFSKQIELLNENYPEFVDSEYVLRNIQDYIEANSDLQLTNISIDDSNQNKQNSIASSSSNSQYDKFDILSNSINFSYYCNVQSAVKFLKYLESFPSILNIESTNYNYIKDTDPSKITTLPLNCSTKVVYYTKILKPPTPTPEPTAAE